MKKTILIITLALISAVSIAQTAVKPKQKEKAQQSKTIIEPVASVDSLHVITLNDAQLKALSDIFQAAQQLLTRSPDMTAYQASEAQKVLNSVAVLIGKQVEPKAKPDTVRKPNLK